MHASLALPKADFREFLFAALLKAVGLARAFGELPGDFREFLFAALLKEDVLLQFFHGREISANFYSRLY